MQVTCYKRSFNVGCPRQIHGRTITPLATYITLVLPRGLLKATSLGNGNRLVAFCGSMAFVCLWSLFLLPLLTVLYILAGSGKTVLSYVSPAAELFFLVYLSYLPVHRSSKRSGICVKWGWPQYPSFISTFGMVESRRSATCYCPFSLSSPANLISTLKFSFPSFRTTVVASSNPARMRFWDA